MNLKKGLNHFERFNFVDPVVTFNNTNFTTLNVTLSTYQTILAFTPHTKVWSCVCMCNSTKIHISSSLILNSATAKVIQVFHLFSHQLAKILPFFKSFCRKFILYTSKKKVGKLIVIQTSTVPHNFVQVFCTPKRSLRGFVLFWRTTQVSLNIPINKTPKSLIRFYLLARYLVQCITNCFTVD